jgi:hypothetical protein
LRGKTTRAGTAGSRRAGRIPVSIYELRIELRDVKPAIWRGLLVPGPIRLDMLHRVIQIALGWTDSHLHRFTVAGTRYGMPDDDFPDTAPTIDEKHMTLAGCVGSSVKRFSYMYDFGDDWEHDVTVESILEAEPSLHYPVCVDGANACPPEDVGGPSGYVEFLEAISDPRHPEHRAMLDWHAGSFDPRAIDLQAINKRLGRIKS